MHLLRIDACAHSSKDFISHCFSICLSAHCILVIIEIEDQREPAFHVAFPEFLILVHRREADCFPNRTATERTVSDIRNDNTRFSVYFLKERATCCNRCTTAYDCVVRINAEGTEESMHRSTKSFMEACFSCKNFSEGTIDQEVDRKLFHCGLIFLYDFENAAAEIIFHDFHELFITEFLDCRKTFCQNFTMASVRSENPVICIEQICLTDGGSFLSD